MVDFKPEQLAAQSREDDQEEELRNLRQALASRPVIEQAKGALMLRYRIHADQAFALLVRWSQHTNTKLRVLATVLVDALPAAGAIHPALADELDYPHQIDPKLAAEIDRLLQ